MSYKTPIKILFSDDSEKFKIADFEFHKMVNEEKNIFLGYTYIELDEYQRFKSGTGKLAISRASELDTVFNEFDKIKYLSCQFILESEYLQNIDNLLMSLRLFQEGEVIAPVSFSMNQSLMQVHYPFFLNESQNYLLNQKDIPEIECLYQKIKENKNAKLEMLLNRFSDAIDYKTKLNNSFVDLVSILESLVVPDTTELTFRFSLYVSHILNSYCDYPISFKSVNEFYKIRSKFAHEGKYDRMSNLELQEKHNQLKNIVRKLILFFINKDYKIDAEQIILNDLKIPVKSDIST